MSAPSFYASLKYTFGLLSVFFIRSRELFLWKRRFL